jgi:hypothetical protein
MEGDFDLKLDVESRVARVSRYNIPKREIYISNDHKNMSNSQK